MSEALAQACVLLWLLSILDCKIPDVHVTCLFSEDCILPCNFTPTGHEAIQWYQQEVLIYSFLQGRDQPDDSSMALFWEQVSHGNASLHLRQCSVKSRGRYRCQVNTTNAEQESIVIVRVEAPIKMVTIGPGQGEEVLCLTKAVYPSPNVQWLTEPPSPSGVPPPSTRIIADPQGLYTVESRLQILKRGLHFTYICLVKSKYTSQTWRASLLQQDMIGEKGQELTIPCIAPKNLQDFTLSWTFTRTSKPTVILTYDSQTRRTSNLWESRAGLDQEQALMGIGSLQLQSLELSGTYTCTFSGFQTRHLVQTRVNITAQRTATQTEDSDSKLWVTAVVVAALVLLITVLLIVRRKCKDSSNPPESTPSEGAEMLPMQSVKTVNDSPVERSQLSADHTNGHS